MAIAGANKQLALQKLAAELNTAPLIPQEEVKDTISEGAGVGFGVERFGISQTSRGAGTTRVYLSLVPQPRPDTVYGCSSTLGKESLALVILSGGRG